MEEIAKEMREFAARIGVDRMEDTAREMWQSALESAKVAQVSGMQAWEKGKVSRDSTASRKRPFLR
jgi:hypothetical protein